jgi:hypothetical protein
MLNNNNFTEKKNNQKININILQSFFLFNNMKIKNQKLSRVEIIYF